MFRGQQRSAEVDETNNPITRCKRLPGLTLTDLLLPVSKIVIIAPPVDWKRKAPSVEEQEEQLIGLFNMYIIDSG